MTNITIDYLLPEVPEINEDLLIKWVNSVISKEGRVADNIQFILCDDNTLLKLNERYLNHDTLTDVITFNYNDEYQNMAGDIFISYERVIENALKYKVPSQVELKRVMVHGVLHLIGYDDQTEEQKSVIRDKENYYLTLPSET